MDFLTFDTETNKGKAFLACAFDGKQDKDFVFRNKEDVIKFFVWLNANSKVGFCYNLEYDISALIKYFGQQAITEFYVEKPIQFEYEGFQYEIGGFINKFVKISKLVTKKKHGVEKMSRQTTTFYDICQYYQYMPLDTASREFLKEEKMQLPEGWIKNMLKYFKSHRSHIIKYCRHDNRLTHRLAALILKMFVDAGIFEKDKISTAKYYSYGYIAKKFINRKANILSFYNEEVNDFLKRFCFGGRTEVMRRGYFDNVYFNDINSAYGSGLADLKNITSHKFTQRIDWSADYFFVDCEFDLPENYIQPIPVKFKQWKYPYGKGRAVIDKRTFLNSEKAGKITHVHKCLNLFAEDRYPFRQIIHRLYNQRQKSYSHKYIFKNLINSYIGKLNEKITKRTWVDEDDEPEMVNKMNDWHEAQDEFEKQIKHCGCNCYYKEKVDPYCKCPTCIEYRQGYGKIKESPALYKIGGNMFYTEKELKRKTHPIYNALVVSGMRNSMYEEGIKMGDNLIGFFTDAVVSKIPMQNLSTKLGGFSEKYKGPLYLVGAGVYENEEGSTLRGYKSKISLMEYALNNMSTDIMKIPSLERIGMGRAIGTLSSFSRFNELIESDKTMNVNFDSNRIWERQFLDYSESLTHNINSQAVKL